MQYSIEFLLGAFSQSVILCGSLVIVAVSVGCRIGMQRLISPVLANNNPLTLLTEENLQHMKARYLTQKSAWFNVMLTAVAGALVASLGLQIYSGVTDSSALVSYVLALVTVFFLAACASTGYHFGSRMGLVKAFGTATEDELVALHKRLFNKALPYQIAELVDQLPKNKRFIHVMAIDHAIHTAKNRGQHETA